MDYCSYIHILKANQCSLTYDSVVKRFSPFSQHYPLGKHSLQPLYLPPTSSINQLNSCHKYKLSPFDQKPNRGIIEIKFQYNISEGWL